MLSSKEFEIRNRRGKRLCATVRVPKGGVRGTALVIHGLAGWRNQSTVIGIAEALTASGYQTVTFDGADCLKGPDASFWNATTTGFIEDVEDMVAFVRSASWFRPPFLLGGHSLGAMSAVRYERTHPGTSSELLLVAPAISWRVDRKDKFLHRMRFLREQVRHMQKKGVLMPIYPPWLIDYLRYDTRKDAPHISCPVFMISAGNDLTVASIEEQRKLVHLFPHITYAEIDGASHIFHEHERELADTIKQWHT